MIARTLVLALLAGSLAAALPPAGHAQQPGPAAPAGAPPATATARPSALPDDVAAVITRLTATMEDAEKSLGRMKDLDDDIGRLRDEVEEVITRATEVADGLRPRLTEIRSQIDKLGPPPAQTAPPEAPAVAQERTRLAAEASALDGAIKTLELVWVRARQTIDRITDLRLTLFTRSLMERMSSPLLPSLWSDVVRDAPQVGRLLDYMASDWWGTMQSKTGVGALGLLLAGGLALFLLARVVVARITKERHALDAGTTRSFFEKAAAASWIAPVRAAPAVLAMVGVYAGLEIMGLLYYPSDRISVAIIRAALIFAAVAALVGTVLSPAEPRRRLVPLSDRSARRVVRILQGIVLVYAADLALISITRTLYLPLSMTVVQSLAASLALAGLLVGLLLTPFEPQEADPFRPTPRDRPRWLKVPLWLAAVVIVASSLLGFVALGRFAARQLVLTGVVALVGILLFLAIRAFTREPAEAAHPVGRMLETRFGLDGPRRQQIARLAELALTLTLFILAFPVLLLQWGFSGADIRDWVKAAVFGFEVGQFRISLARILIGIVIFTILLFATRLVQRWLREQVLAPPRVDPGIASSVDTAVGYAGIVLAGALAISYAGLDITNIAIVAGALSVGIGFGLQSIVNNFVSGLILLIERPIKVGDWVVVGGEQGNVRRVSVRSTEIETFDRASLIVPNSELISSRVLNWTHRNTLGRIIINVSVAAKSDPRGVIALLERCALAHPHVLRFPEPRAYLEGMNRNALEFSIRVQLGDVNRALEARSELRVAILEALRAAEVEIV